MPKLRETQKEMNLGFRVPAPGTYNWVVTEGIRLFKAQDQEENPEDKKTVMLNIPCEILTLARNVKGNKGTDDEIGSSTQFSIVLNGKDGTPNQRGEDQLLTFLTITGVMKRLMQKFPGEIGFSDQKFIDTLALALPGKQFKARHSIRKYNDRDQIQWERLEEADSAKTGTVYKANDQGQVPEENDDGDDWS